MPLSAKSIPLAVFVLAGLAAGPGRAQSIEVYPGCDAAVVPHQREIHATPADLAAKAAAAEPGDLILLQSGDYGAVALSKRNAGFVAVVAAPGQRPVLSGLVVSGSHWIVRGLTIVGYSPARLYPNGWPANAPLVALRRSDNIAISGNTVASALGPIHWKEEVRGVPDSQTLSEGIVTNNDTCVSITANHVSNVFNGIMVAGDQAQQNGKRFVVNGNDINDFAGDGIDHSVSDAVIHGNHISNNHDVCNEICVHTDGIQGWNYAARPGLLNTNLVIDGNVIIHPHDDRLELPSPALQGITIFNGNWDNLRVTNNVVVVNAYHGISLYGVHNSLIANNTVVGSGDRPTWIMTTDQVKMQGGAQVKDLIIRNNLAPLFKIETRGAQVDHNQEIGNPGRFFVRFDAGRRQFDLHLKPGSPAIAKGAPMPKVTDDADGRARGGQSDLGAYRYAGG